MSSNERPDPPQFVLIRETSIDVFRTVFHGVLRWLYTLAVFGGCTYLVFWRGESGWLFLPACLLLLFRRGL